MIPYPYGIPDTKICRAKRLPSRPIKTLTIAFDFQGKVCAEKLQQIVFKFLIGVHFR